MAEVDPFPTCYLEFMGHTITVMFTPERPIRDNKPGELLDGYLDPGSEIIFIYNELPEDRKREVLAHELTHLVDIDTSPTKHLTENQIGRISRGFQGILADNPDLAMYFARKLKTGTLIKRLEKRRYAETDV